MNNPLLSIEHLSVAFNHQQTVVDDISFAIYPGETFALVGESGSGKSITALSVLRLLPNNARLTASAINLQDDNLLARSELELCKIRGKRIGFIFQDPMSSLNPVMTIAEQLAEVLKIHFEYARNASGSAVEQIQQRVLALLQQVELPEPERRMTEYPHQLSGGQRQRVMIAIALAGEPELLIADEPTTSLDVTIQAQILQLLRNIQLQTNMALWLISHDLALVSGIADRIAVMQRGKLVETGRNPGLFENPQHTYTRQLLAALPRLESSGNRQVQHHAPLLTVHDFKVYYPIRKGFFKRIVDYVKAVDGVSFSLQQGKTLALVGESGCGKTTLGKGLLSLISGATGEVYLNDLALHQLQGDTLRKQRAAMQIVFQDPFASMNPRMLVGDIIAEGLRALHPDIAATERQLRVRKLITAVGLPETAASRYPHEFSGGQRQRICIARALAVEPKLIVCDEPTSALDVSVQAQIIQLLKKIQQERGVSYLFITHDFGVVAEIADDVAVMYQGKIVEHGSVAQVLNQPVHSYTQRLLSAVPRLGAAYFHHEEG